MIKPFSENNWENDAAQTIILKEFLSRLEKLGLKAEVMHEIRYDDAHVQKHYHEHYGRPYYGNLANCLLQNKAIGMVITGDDAINTLRGSAGATIKVDKKTGEVKQIHEPGSIRYNLAFTFYQMKNGVKLEDVVIPKNYDGCQLVYNDANERVDIMKDGVKVCEMFMTQNFIHTSSSVEDAQNEIETFLDQHEVNKQANLDALKAHAKHKALKNSKPTM